MKILDRFLYLRRGHVASDPRCAHFRALTPGSWKERRSRGIACRACR